MNVYTWLKLSNNDGAIKSAAPIHLLDLDTYVVSVHTEADGYWWIAYDPEKDSCAGESGPYYSAEDACIAAEHWLDGLTL